MKLEKGDFGYLNSRQKAVALRTGAMFAFTLLLVILGRVIFSQYEKVFVICAILSVLPAAMSAVNLIMYFRFQTGRKEIYDEIEVLKGKVNILYDCVITTEKKSYGTNAIAVINKNIIALSEYDNTDVNDLERHFSYMARKNGFKNWTIKVFTDYGKFRERIKYLADKQIVPNSTDKDMVELVKAISL
ncbi:MAG: hypothetical protein K6G84_12030 [Lachnospiraceae bacterium]|nr:hypothetical protein [Lachnospiraceae bacterium]